MPMTAATIGATAHTRIRRDGIRCSPGGMIGRVQETIESAQAQNLADWRREQGGVEQALSVKLSRNATRSRLSASLIVNPCTLGA